MGKGYKVLKSELIWLSLQPNEGGRKQEGGKSEFKPADGVEGAGWPDAVLGRPSAPAVCLGSTLASWSRAASGVSSGLCALVCSSDHVYKSATSRGRCGAGLTDTKHSE